MAGTRRKTQRRGGGRKKRTSGIAGSTLMWGAALVAIVGGIAAYDNSAAVRRFAAGMMPAGEEKVAVRPPRKPEERKSGQSRSATPVPPREVAARNSEAKRGPAPQRPDALHTAAIIPPAPIGRPAQPATPVAVIRLGMPSVQGSRAKFYLCGTAKQDDCVVSADSFILKGQKIRIAGIEVPSIKKPRCEAERIKASDAKLRIRAFLDSGPFDVIAANANDEDSTGQKIRAVTRNGISLSDILVREGLARRPGASGGWC